MNIEAVTAVAANQFRRLRPRGHEFGDILSIAAIAALQSPGQYDLCKAKWAIIERVRTDRRHDMKQFPHGAFAWQEREQPDLFREAMRGDVVEKLECLSEMEREVVVQYFWHERELLEIGQMHGHSTNWAWHHMRKALAKLRKKMGVRNGRKN